MNRPAAPRSPRLSVGSTVMLSRAPGNLSRYAWQEGEVKNLFTQAGNEFAAVAFGGEMVPVPLSYLKPAGSAVAGREGVKNGSGAAGAKAARRPAFYLHEPKDERSEEEIQREGVRWLEGLGYTVLQVGQGRDAAICPKCSRESRQSGGAYLVKIICKRCGSLGYAPSTNSTKGTPDTFVSMETDKGHTPYPRGAWIGIEWKQGPTANVKPEQERLRDAGRIYVVWSKRMLAQAVVEFERGIGVVPIAEVLEMAQEKQNNESTDR